MEREASREVFTLLDLVLAVQDEAHDDREVIATLVHLLAASIDRHGNPETAVAP